MDLGTEGSLAGNGSGCSLPRAAEEPPSASRCTNTSTENEWEDLSSAGNVKLQMTRYTTCMIQDGAEHGSRVASSEKTLFVYYLLFYVLLYKSVLSICILFLHCLEHALKNFTCA